MADNIQETEKQVNAKCEIPFDILLKGTDKDEFVAWQKGNKFYGKNISVMGDSISTLEGYNPDGYSVFYKGDICEKTGVKTINDTWWGKVIGYLGGNLLVNNSWSGSRVSGNFTQIKPGCSNERTANLHKGDVQPDVVIVYFGFNDWAGGVEIDCEGSDDMLLQPLCEMFSHAYSYMIQSIERNYPNAEIYCCTLNTTFISNRFFLFPYENSGIHIEKYNEVIRKIASHGRHLVDLYKCETPYDTIDGSHPNADGMKILAKLICENINRFPSSF